MQSKSIMAIVLISPKKRQKVFIWGVASLLVLVVIAIASFIFIPGLTNQTINIPDTGAYITPDIKLNLKIVDSQQVQNLQPFLNIETEFAYIATDKNGKQAVGKISATDKDNAKKSLEAMGFVVLSLQEANMGRSNPFVPY